MCRYEYARYGACDHAVIECREICGVTLWRAGLTGTMVLCLPSMVPRPNQASGPNENESLQFTKFVGFTGSCNGCIEEFNIQDNVRLQDDLFNYIAIPEGQLSPDAVFYFHVDELMTTFPHLLAIDQHLDQAEMDLGPIVVFPKTNERVTWEVLRTQQPFKVSGIWVTTDGYPEQLTELLNKLQCPTGLSPQDREMFGHVLMNNLDVKQFYQDVFKTRGMPWALFCRLCAQIRDKIQRRQQEMAERAAMAVNSQPTASHLGNSDQSTSIDAGSKRSFSSMQENTFQNNGSSSNTQQSNHDQGDSERPAQRPRLSQPGEPSSSNNNCASQVQSAPMGSSQQLATNTAGMPGSGSTLAPPALHSGSPTSTPLQSLGQRPVGQFDLAACRAMQEQARASQAVPVQNLTAVVAQTHAAMLQAAQAQVPQVQAPQTQVPQAQAPQAQAAQVQAPQAQAPQAQAAQVQAPQAQAAQAQAPQAPVPQAQVPQAQVPQAQVPQVQAPQAQAAQANPAQPQAPRPPYQLVDTSRALELHAQYLRGHAPSEMPANQARASQFRSAFNHIIEAQGLVSAAAQAGISLTVEEAQKIAEAHKAQEAQRAQEAGSDASSLPSRLSSIDPSLVDPSLVGQSAASQSPSNTTTTQQSPQSLSTTPATPSSPTSQHPTSSNTEDIPGKGKGILPHVVAKAPFFLNEQERDLAIDQLTDAWTAYHCPSETAINKEQAASWIINFSLNFKQQWALSAESFGFLNDTTLMQLTKPRSGEHPTSPDSLAPPEEAGPSRPQESSGVGSILEPRFQYTWPVQQAENNDSSSAFSSGSQMHDPVMYVSPWTVVFNEAASDHNDAEDFAI